MYSVPFSVCDAIFVSIGNDLDARTRNILWENGWDYRHGTGHGIGYFLTVHEGRPAGPHSSQLSSTGRNRTRHWVVENRSYSSTLFILSRIMFKLFKLVRRRNDFTSAVSPHLVSALLTSQFAIQPSPSVVTFRLGCNVEQTFEDSVVEKVSSSHLQNPKYKICIMILIMCSNK